MQGAESPIAKKSHRGQKGFIVTAEVLKTVYDWACSGVYDMHIADHLRISTKTFCEHKKKNPQFAQALKEGRALGIREVIEKLKTSDNTAGHIFFLKVHGKMMEEERVKHYQLRKEEIELKKQELEFKIMLASKLTPKDAMEFFEKHHYFDVEDVKLISKQLKDKVT